MAKAAIKLEAPEGAVDGGLVTITPMRVQELVLTIAGMSPYLQARFSTKARDKMRATQQAGSTAKKGRAREPRDFEADFVGAQHFSEDGWVGIPASAFRNAAIDACRMAGFQMTRAKMSIFIVAAGFDQDDGTPLVKIEGAPPEPSEMAVRNASGVTDLRVRPMWRAWGCRLVVRFDADQFTGADVINLFHRAGLQVGVGEGRPFSKNSAGMGFGTFRVVSAGDVVSAVGEAE